MADLKDKVVLITGASGGIGGSTAVEYARLGAAVVITGRNVEKLNAAKQRCLDVGLDEKKVLLVSGDLTKYEDVKKIVDKTIQQFGRLDVLVNNAAAYISKTFEQSTMDDFDVMINMNIRGTVMLIKESMPHLVNAKGNIINISSDSGTHAYYEGFAYSTSKAALNHMTKMLALEYGQKGVRVNAVLPSLIDTDVFLNPASGFEGKPELIQEFYKLFEKECPVGRVGKPEDIAMAIIFLSSKAASFINGVLLLLDGGVNLKTTIM